MGMRRRAAERYNCPRSARTRKTEKPRPTMKTRSKRNEEAVAKGKASVPPEIDGNQAIGQNRTVTMQTKPIQGS